MSIFDRGSVETGVTEAGSTGTVRDVSTIDTNSNGQQQNDQNVVQTTTTNTPEGKKNAIVLDGPLSTIYTKALNLVYAQGTNASVSNESQAIDAANMAALIQQTDREAMQKAASAQDTDYLYVLSGDELDNDGLGHAFESIRIALDLQCFKNVVVVMECLDNVPSTAGILGAYLGAQKIKTYYSRASAVAALKG